LPQRPALAELQTLLFVCVDRLRWLLLLLHCRCRLGHARMLHSIIRPRPLTNSSHLEGEAGNRPVCAFRLPSLDPVAILAEQQHSSPSLAIAEVKEVKRRSAIGGLVYPRASHWQMLQSGCADVRSFSSKESATVQIEDTGKSQCAEVCVNALLKRGTDAKSA
jgi:hypothetical protein